LKRGLNIFCLLTIFRLNAGGRRQRPRALYRIGCCLLRPRMHDQCRGHACCVRQAAAGGNRGDRRAAPYVYLPVPVAPAFPIRLPTFGVVSFHPLPPFSSAVARGMDLFASHLPLLPGLPAYACIHSIGSANLIDGAYVRARYTLVATVRTSGCIIRRTEMYVRARRNVATHDAVRSIRCVSGTPPAGGDRIRGIYARS
jgi:hypothetical protein